MDGQSNPQQELLNGLQFQLGMLFSMSSSLHSTTVVVSQNLSFPLSSIVRYEAVEQEIEGNLTDKVLPMIFFTDGKEIDLTPEQKELFKKYWDLKVEVDAKLAATTKALFNLLFLSPPQLQPGQPA